MWEGNCPTLVIQDQGLHQRLIGPVNTARLNLRFSHRTVLNRSDVIKCSLNMITFIFREWGDSPSEHPITVWDMWLNYGWHLRPALEVSMKILAICNSS